MGSVPYLYTTGDNDPEIEPVKYYRHFLYCDGCGSFELGSWTKPDHHRALEKGRWWLGAAAIFSLPLVMVPAWQMLSLFPLVSDWVIVVAALAMATILWGFVLGAEGEKIRTRWSFFKSVIFWLPLFFLAESLIRGRFEPRAVLGAGLLLITGLLAVRAFLGSRIQTIGMRCRGCGATYAYGSAFFSELDANPRGLTVEAVPRPLGVSPFRIGEHLGKAPPEEPVSRLPA